MCYIVGNLNIKAFDKLKTKIQSDKLVLELTYLNFN
jgi:hypothetical protein